MNPAEDYILNQPEPYRNTLLHLRSVIERTVPTVALRFKYKIPFYYLDGRPFCYLNQSSDYVDLGFWNAAHISVHPEHLVMANRKVMRSLRYRNLATIDDVVLVDVLKEAYRVKDKKFRKN